jgi:electron transfer flavoprotein beta subunit
MNPFDELSIEEAVRLRERKLPVSSITAVSIGPAKSGDVLRTALAMGADDAVHVESKVGEAEGVGGLEPLDVAKALRKIVEDGGHNVVLLGKQSIDDDAGQTGQMLAGLLGWAQATQASKVAFPDSSDISTVEVTREVDGGAETLRAKLPVVITTDLRLNEPRYASLPNIMKAKKKPLGVTPKQRLKTVKVEEPPPRKGGVKVEDVDGLVGKLKELGAL